MNNARFPHYIVTEQCSQVRSTHHQHRGDQALPTVLQLHLQPVQNLALHRPLLQVRFQGLLRDISHRLLHHVHGGWKN